MIVERGGFLLLVSTLAAGGAAGYVASEKDVVPHLDPAARAPKATPAAPAPIAPAAVPVQQAQLTAAHVEPPAKPACDDSVGEPDACPIGMPTEEGACGGALAAARCSDFKKTMKPRVAQAAVSCLNKLKGGERCDPKRVDLCGHLALMNACEDAATTVSTGCDAIATSCQGSSIAPSKAECSLAMSGLKEVGREALVDCAKKHCTDKGILGCEAVSVVNLKP